MNAATAPTLDRTLTRREQSVVRSFVCRILEEVPAGLVQAALFGSKARGTARPDSDVDILLVFADLPPDREPHAGIAERIAAEVARSSGIPVTVWSVASVDTLRGNRTPMLVDALEDAIPIWCWPEPLTSVPFTAEDALRCCESLLERVGEGSEEFALCLRGGDPVAAARRARDDLVRLCTALLLLRGVTRPRRGEAILAVSEGGVIPTLPPGVSDVLAWGRGSFGPSGRDEDGPVLPAPELASIVGTISFLRWQVNVAMADLSRRVARPGIRFPEKRVGASVLHQVRPSARTP